MVLLIETFRFQCSISSPSIIKLYKIKDNIRTKYLFLSLYFGYFHFGLYVLKTFSISFNPCRYLSDKIYCSDSRNAQLTHA